jgi:hypothetical protein
MGLREGCTATSCVQWRYGTVRPKASRLRVLNLYRPALGHLRLEIGPS